MKIIPAITASRLYYYSFSLYLLMQFAVTAAAPHTIVFYALVTPAALWYFYQQRAELAPMLRDKNLLLFGMFFAYLLLHALFFEHTGKVVRNTLVTAWFVFVATAFFTLLSTEQRGRLLVALALTAGLCASLSLALHFNMPVAEARLRPIGRADNQVLGAFVYCMGAIFALGALLTLSLRPALAAALISCLLLCCTIVALTHSRMALAVLLLVLLLAALQIACTHRRWRYPLLGVLGILVITALFAADNLLHDYIAALAERGDSFRLALWSATLEKIATNPWLGHGMMARIEYPLNAHVTTYSPHNIFLTTWLGGGLVALLLLLAALAYLGWRFWFCQPWKPDFSFITLLLIGSALASGMIDHSRIIKSPSPLWMIFWLPLAMGIACCIRQRCASRNMRLPAI